MHFVQHLHRLKGLLGAKDEMFRKLGYSQDELAAQKDEIVLKAADSLIDAINKLKSALLTEKEKSNH